MNGRVREHRSHHKEGSHRRMLLAIVLVLGSNSFWSLLRSCLFPQINPFDEAKYIVSGSQLLHFQVRDLAWGPLVALFYAPFHLVFGGSPDWFMLEAWAGRCLLRPAVADDLRPWSRIEGARSSVGSGRALVRGRPFVRPLPTRAMRFLPAWRPWRWQLCFAIGARRAVKAVVLGSIWSDWPCSPGRKPFS